LVLSLIWQIEGSSIMTPDDNTKPKRTEPVALMEITILSNPFQRRDKDPSEES